MPNNFELYAATAMHAMMAHNQVTASNLTEEDMARIAIKSAQIARLMMREQQHNETLLKHEKP